MFSRLATSMIQKRFPESVLMEMLCYMLLNYVTFITLFIFNVCLSLLKQNQQTKA